MDWMKDIPDETKISEMTIPGTHDSCSLFGICCTRTQTWTLVEQMKAGIRFFDIRLRRINDTLRAYHGFVDQKETFDTILAYAFDFLEKNPTETIMMEVISEYDPKNCTKSFAQLYDEYTRSYTDKIVPYENKDTVLGKIRGKLFVIKIFEGRTSSIPNFLIQNEWTVNIRCHMNNKKRRIKENIHRAISINNNKIFLNYLSASSDYAMMTPYTAATKCNEIAMRYHGRLGIVMADYPGEDFIKHLINQNFVNQGMKDMIKNGDLVYVIHNDTHKYLFLDKNEKNNNIYCVKEKVKLNIRHKNTEIGRDNFKIGDEFILTNQDGFELEFKIGGTFSGNEDFIDNNSLLLIQYNKDDEMKYIECKYENKNSKKHYLLNFTKNNGTYTYYFKIEKVKEDEELKE
jgi:hypothetical protein